MKPTRLHRFTLMFLTVFVLISSVSLFAQQERSSQSDRSDSSGFELTAYLNRAIESSDEIADAKEVAEDAADRVEETRLSGVSMYDLEQAEIDAHVAELRVSNTRNTILMNSIDLFFALISGEQQYTFAKRALELSKSAEVLAERRYNEGVKTEEAYLSDVSSRLSAELALIEAQHSLIAAKRRAERRIGKKPEGEISLVGPDVPVLTEKLEEQSLLEQARTIEPAYVEAMRKAELMKRRLESLQRLQNSVAPKELEDARSAAESASSTLEKQQAVLEDRVWQLVSDYRILRKSVENERHQLMIAEKNWSSRQEKYDYGILSDNQLDQYRLSYDKQQVSMKRTIERLFVHRLKIGMITGTDVLEEVERLLSR